jgi:hypothetical protein
MHKHDVWFVCHKKDFNVLKNYFKMDGLLMSWFVDRVRKELMINKRSHVIQELIKRADYE